MMPDNDRVIRLSLYEADARDVAQRLIGCRLVSTVDGERTTGIIVETEAYLADDPASHSFRGQTARNASMFGPGGHAYVYRSHGVCWCFNVVTGPQGRGEAVLIRALEPTEGTDTMQRRRRITQKALLCKGPGRMCQALGITRDLDGHRLDVPPLWIEDRGTEERRVVSSRRVGIAVGQDFRWRFLDGDSPYISRRPI